MRKTLLLLGLFISLNSSVINAQSNSSSAANCSMFSLPDNLTLELQGYFPFCEFPFDVGPLDYYGTVLDNQEVYVNDRFNNPNAALKLGEAFIEMPPDFFKYYNRLTPFSISIWFTKDSINFQGDLISASYLSKKFNIGSRGNNNIYVSFGDTYTDTVSTNAWNHLVYVFSPDEEKIYLNGQLRHTNKVFNFKNAGPDFPFVIGATDNSGNNKWQGKVDDIFVFSRALSDCEVAQIYQVTDLGYHDLSPANYFDPLYDSLTMNEGEELVLNNDYQAVGYLWNTGDTTKTITVTVEGNYVVQNKLFENCYLSDSTYVKVLPLPVISMPINRKFLVACEGSSIELAIDSLNVTSVKWSTGQSQPLINTKILSDTVISATVSYADLSSVLYEFMINKVKVNTDFDIKSADVQCFKNNEFSFQNTSTFTDLYLNTLIWKVDTSIVTDTDSLRFHFNKSGTFNVTLTAQTASGCTDTITKTVTVYPAPIIPVLTLKGDSAICANDTIAINSSLPVNNKWLYNNMPITQSSGFTLRTNLPGYYSVFYKSAFGCNSDTSSAIKITLKPSPTKPILSSNKMDHAFCIGDSIQLYSNYNNANKWLLNGAVLNNLTGKTLTANGNGTYAVVAIHENGCESEPSDPLTTKMDTTFPEKPTIVLKDNVLVATDAKNYKWYYNNILLPNATTNTLTYKNKGLYMVETTNNACWSKSIQTYIAVDPSSNITSSKFYAYPNPSNGSFFAELKLEKKYTGMLQLILTNTNGKVIYSKKMYVFNDANIRIPVEGQLEKGTYIVQISINGYTPESIKVIVL